MITLAKNERLIYAGNTALRAPNGKPLAAVPQYMIVPADEANPADIAELKDNERLIVAGTVHTGRQSAEERFAALKAGRAMQAAPDGVPLYIKESADNINPKTGLSTGEEKAIEPLISDLVSTFAMQMRKREALAKQGK